MYTSTLQGYGNCYLTVTYCNLKNGLVFRGIKLSLYKIAISMQKKSHSRETNL